jgi:ribonuclease/clavin/mitogillin
VESVANGIAVVAVRTPTLPPATHTNTYVVGHETLTIVDPASPYPDEQQRLAELLLATGKPVERILLTHHHHDHVSGVNALRGAFPGLKVWAHERTRQRLEGHVHVDVLLDHDAIIDCGGVTLRAVFTPGHAPGHLVYVDPATGAAIAGDMVAGIGTILIDEADGDLSLYLDSLARLKTLGLSVLLPSHGPSLHQPEAILSFYIAHRHHRTEQVRHALSEPGKSTAAELVPHVYTELDPRAFPIAAIQLGSHLRWLHDHGVVQRDGPRFSLRC